VSQFQFTYRHILISLPYISRHYKLQLKAEIRAAAIEQLRSRSAAVTSARFRTLPPAHECPRCGSDARSFPPVIDNSSRRTGAIPQQAIAAALLIQRLYDSRTAVKTGYCYKKQHVVILIYKLQQKLSNNN